VLDVLMPTLDGWETCRAIRLRSSVPVLMLTARDSVEDKVDGLDAGADDYLVKPFALTELFARLRALLRRTATGDDGCLHFADLDLDPVAREVRRAGNAIELTRTEFALLELFMLHPRKVLPRSALFESVWGYDLGLASNSLEVFVGYLRKKTEAWGGHRLIHTVRGIGYVMREQSVPR
jgi:two-component system response regulator MprA